VFSAHSEGPDLLDASVPADPPTLADCHVREIPPGLSLAPQRHPFEQIILVLAGRGSTSFCNDDGASVNFEWKAGTLFAVPLDTTCRHFNGSGTQCARFVAVTTAPGIINARGDSALVESPCPDFVEASHAAASMSDLDHSSLLDALDCPLLRIPECGAGGHLSSHMGTRGLSILISQLPPETCGKPHAYGPDAYTIVLAGEGYSLVWPEGGQRMRWAWRQGALLAAPNAWWRQHFNSGKSPARLVTVAPNISLMQSCES
jgi:hypothetical protein